jgi:hypothetical protein
MPNLVLHTGVAGTMALSQHVLLDLPYQGNIWWAFMGVFSILMLAHVLFRLRQRHRAGQKVYVNQVIGAIIIFSIFMVISISQVITHW